LRLFYLCSASGLIVNNFYGSLGIGVVNRQFWRQLDCRHPAVQLLAQQPRQFPESHLYLFSGVVMAFCSVVLPVSAGHGHIPGYLQYLCASTTFQTIQIADLRKWGRRK
jgi:hypothetical protein